MPSKPLHRRVAAWIACFAILLSSLAPSVSQAINAHRLAVTGPIAEICSVDGKKFADTVAGTSPGRFSHAGAPARSQTAKQAKQAADSAGQRGSKHSDQHAELCPFCFTHAGSFGLAAPLIVLAVPDPGMASRPSLFYQSHRPLFAWRIAHPRGPPSSFS